MDFIGDADGNLFDIVWMWKKAGTGSERSGSENGRNRTARISGGYETNRFLDESYGNADGTVLYFENDRIRYLYEDYR